MLNADAIFWWNREPTQKFAVHAGSLVVPQYWILDVSLMAARQCMSGQNHMSKMDWTKRGFNRPK